MTTSTDHQRNSRIAFIHALPDLAPTFQSLLAEHAVPVQAAHIADMAFFDSEMESGVLTAADEQRLLAYARTAVEQGADGVVVTCSFLGTAVDRHQDALSVPFVRVDEPMARRALATSNRIGVLATANTSLRSSTALLKRIAKEIGRDVELAPRLCEGAFDRLRSGDAHGHDAAVRTDLRELAAEADVVVLSQASMARAARQEPLSTPVLTSPPLCMQWLAERFGKRPQLSNGQATPD